jgi:hypothetical protein
MFKDSAKRLMIKGFGIFVALIAFSLFSASAAYAADDCPAGQSFTKASGGIGPMPCGTGQCRENGYLYFTACTNKSDCLALSGITDGGNKAGCSDIGGQELFCCRAHKNRCNTASVDPNKLFLCTNEQQCIGGGGTVFNNAAGCSGEFSKCCEFPDSPQSPMKIAGEKLIPSAQANVTSGSSQTVGAKRVDRSYEHLDNFCHTAVECAEGEGTFEGGFGCPFKGDQAQGYCLAKDAEYELQNPLFGVTKIAGLRNLIKILFNGSIGLLIIVSAVMFLFGAFKYMLSAVATSIQKTKEIMVDSLVGLAIGLGAFAILSNVNPNLLSLTKAKIYMINRVSFYDIVYCTDLVDQSKKLMYAGTREAPLGYSDQLKAEGFELSIDEAECGKEYFIDGADTLAVCMGSGCAGGVCLNCSSNKAPGCKSDSAYEYACLDAHWGGNVILKGPWDGIEVGVSATCKWKEGNQVKLTSQRLHNEDLRNIFTGDETNEVSDGGAVGHVGAYSMKLNAGQVTKLKAFEVNCKKEHSNGEVRVLLNLNLKSSAKTLVNCVGCPPTGQETVFVSKTECNKVVRPPAPPTFITGPLGDPDAYNKYFDERFEQGWTVQEIVDVVENKKPPISCSMTAKKSVSGELLDSIVN